MIKNQKGVFLQKSPNSSLILFLIFIGQLRDKSAGERGNLLFYTIVGIASSKARELLGRSVKPFFGFLISLLKGNLLYFPLLAFEDRDCNTPERNWLITFFEAINKLLHIRLTENRLCDSHEDRRIPSKRLGKLIRVSLVHQFAKCFQIQTDRFLLPLGNRVEVNRPTFSPDLYSDLQFDKFYCLICIVVVDLKNSRIYAGGIECKPSFFHCYGSTKQNYGLAVCVIFHKMHHIADKRLEPVSAMDTHPPLIKPVDNDGGFSFLEALQKFHFIEASRERVPAHRLSF